MARRNVPDVNINTKSSYWKCWKDDARKNIVDCLKCKDYRRCNSFKEGVGLGDYTENEEEIAAEVDWDEMQRGAEAKRRQIYGTMPVTERLIQMQSSEEKFHEYLRKALKAHDRGKQKKVRKMMLTAAEFCPDHNIDCRKYNFCSGCPKIREYFIKARQ